MKKNQRSLDDVEVRFRELVDQSPPTLSPKMLNDLVALYRHFGLDDAVGLSRNDVTEHLYAVIARELHEPTDSGINLMRLRRQIVIRHFADDVPLAPYHSVVRALHDAAKGSTTIPFSEDARWRKAIAAAKDFLLLSPDVFPEPDLLIRRRSSREIAAAQAISSLRKAGYSLSARKGQAWLEDKERDRIAKDIDRRVRELGGVDVADRVFQSIRRKFDAAQQRHHVVRDASTAVRERPAAVPWTYLLNLAVKYPMAVVAPSNASGKFADLVHLATALGATFDVEPFGAFEVMFHTGKGLPAFLQSIAVYDAMFTLVQTRPTDVPRILNGLLDWLPAGTLESKGFSLADAVAVADVVLSWSPKPGPVLLSEGIISRRSGVPPTNTKAVLDVVTHGDPGANQKFLVPSDQLAVDFWFQPLVHEMPAEYLLFDRSWCAPAFFEALTAAVRKILPKVDDGIGVAFESFVRNELRRHEIVFAEGDYDTSDGHAECDIVVETEKHVLFIELKKKVLTRMARSGSDVAILLDLAQSMFDAQIQLAGHELALYKFDAIELGRAGVRTKVERKGRTVERVALGLLDFGAMHDRTIMMQILETVLGYDMKGNTTEHDEKISEVRKRAVELRRLTVELEKFREQKPPFFCSWFLSLGQLLIVLDDVKGNEAFKKSLFTSRHVMAGTLDFYFEHQWMKQMKESAAK